MAADYINKLLAARCWTVQQLAAATGIIDLDKKLSGEIILHDFEEIQILKVLHGVGLATVPRFITRPIG